MSEGQGKGALTTIEGGGPPELAGALSVDAVVKQVALVQNIMSGVMKKDEHFGVIPGTNGKPTLLKPGAEKLAHTFLLAPRYTVERIEMPGEHRGYEVVCEISSITAGNFLGAGVGNASTMETKYRFRKGVRKCPKCGKAAIIKGKREYGGGWLCFAQKGGCGQKFKDGDKAIEDQETGRVEHDNPADYYNTVMKMAKKRAFVDAVLTVTAASDIFVQDMEDLNGNGVIDAEFRDAPPAAQAEQKGKGPTLGEVRKRIWAAVLAEQGGDEGKARVRLAEITGQEDASKLTKPQAKKAMSAFKVGTGEDK